jgi:iron(III) transport system ATP-binding protein
MAGVVIENVTKRFGETVAVSDFSAEIEDGEFFTLLGPSGCGKTTLLRCIAGFLHVTRGRIFIGGRIVSSEKAREFIQPEDRNLGMVFQSYAVWPHMNVYRNVAYPLRIKKKPEREIRKEVERVLVLLKLDQLENRYPHELSGGQQQRVALGRSLIMDPDVLLLDEPLSNLDAKLREEMRFELKELQKRIGVTIVYVTHDQGEAMVMSSRVCVMNEGRIHQTGSPHEIYRNPSDRFVASFIGKSNFIEGDVVERRGKRLQVRIGGGHVVEAEAGGSTEVSMVTLMVRYHSVELSGKKREGFFPSRVRLATYLGDLFLYELEIGNTTVMAQTPGERTFSEGEKVFVRLNNPVLFRK